MKKSSMAKLFMLAALVGTVQAGCVSDPLQFRKCDMTHATVLGVAEGTSTGIMLFNIIPINQNHRFSTAYQDAVSSLGGTCLTDVTIQEKWFWAYVLNGYNFTVKGTVVKEGI
jgi:hypothetical protein